MRAVNRLLANKEAANEEEKGGIVDIEKTVKQLDQRVTNLENERNSLTLYSTLAALIKTSNYGKFLFVCVEALMLIMVVMAAYGVLVYSGSQFVAVAYGGLHLIGIAYIFYMINKKVYGKDKTKGSL